MSDSTTQQERMDGERAQQHGEARRVYQAKTEWTESGKVTLDGRETNLIVGAEAGFDAPAALKRLSQGRQDARARQIQALERVVVNASRAHFKAHNEYQDRLLKWRAGGGPPAVEEVERFAEAALHTGREWAAAVERLNAELEGEK